MLRPERNSAPEALLCLRALFDLVFVRALFDLSICADADSGRDAWRTLLSTLRPMDTAYLKKTAVVHYNSFNF